MLCDLYQDTRNWQNLDINNNYLQLCRRTQWILDARYFIHNELIKRTFLKCEISNAVDTTDDNGIYEQFINQVTSESSNEDSRSEISQNVG